MARVETKRGKSVAVVEREDAVNRVEVQPGKARVEAGEAATAGAVTAAGAATTER